jgi:hypothetical protein
MIYTLHSCNAYVTFIVPCNVCLCKIRLLLHFCYLLTSHILFCINHRLARQEQQLALVSRERDDLVQRVEALNGSVDEFNDNDDDVTVTSNSYKDNSVYKVHSIT